MDRATRRHDACPRGAGDRRSRRGRSRPLVDTIVGSRIQNLKELRPGTVRILFVFDPWGSSVLLVAGDKAGQWNAWYREAIPRAEDRYARYLQERQAEEGRK
ncbi:type II toxin-antitoxin system RelE/ParE family toxin [Amycolatopsis sp., V23-08]|uniref:Type II toxin-antitoxin system RelE/ParE family toxin n=1 Tax=Amycolatopsis heterodermiae TaxID=3110235 RepID=A0ABU5QXZ1_9PSEU|nr:type II toxin-antitoxin system RelE/ParE family toxin [Amycolatopsis sp., V23-08]MEA5358469.1 type II toxin-antitoxin system RelE/ParE family toxin [Amycolatopsis sp., V23-08]